MEKPYNVVLYPGKNYFRHFLVFAENPVAAVNKLNYQARQALPLLREQYPTDKHHKVQRLLHIIHASRRYKRWYKHRFACTHKRYCEVYEIPTSIVHEGQLSFGPHTESLLQNLLPDLMTPEVGNEQRLD